MEITYNIIEPLILDTTLEGSRITCQFQTPNSSKIIESIASIRRQKTVKSQVSHTVKRGMMNQFRRTAVTMLRSIFGGGLVSRTASQAINSASRNSGATNSFTEEEQHEAIVTAFKKVQNQFYWDKAREEWTSPKSLSPFERQLTENPVDEQYDKEILARLLVEIANADGTITYEEKDFLKSFMSNDFGSIDDLLEMEGISEMECEEVTESAKSSIYLLAWTVSLVDHDLDPKEAKLLANYGILFGFEQDEIDKISKVAKFYVLDNALANGDSKSDILALAPKIGLSNRDAERAMIQYKKRNS